MQIHQIKPKTKNKKKKYIGRGGKRGTYSGRGIKGQKARAGRKMRPEIRDMIKKLPKKRGYGKNTFRSFQKRPVVISLEKLEKFFNGGETVNPKVLFDKKVIKMIGGKMPMVKILADGELSKKLVIEGCLFSESAKQKIEKAGGSIK